jgi:hypothetical protein
MPAAFPTPERHALGRESGHRGAGRCTRSHHDRDQHGGTRPGRPAGPRRGPKRGVTGHRHRTPPCRTASPRMCLASNLTSPFVGNFVGNFVEPCRRCQSFRQSFRPRGPTDRPALNRYESSGLAAATTDRARQDLLGARNGRSHRFPLWSVQSAPVLEAPRLRPEGYGGQAAAGLRRAEVLFAADGERAGGPRRPAVRMLFHPRTQPRSGGGQTASRRLEVLEYVLASLLPPGV